MSEYFDLGSHGRKVSTASAEAQKWFDRGLVWCYAFNHEEAVRCFREASAADERCAMAYWGVAYALGPNYNKPWADFDSAELSQAVATAHAAAAHAVEYAQDSSAVERALIDAIKLRYPDEQPAADCDVWSEAYASAMRDVYQRFPDDLDVCTLFAESLMNLNAWELWDRTTGEPLPDTHALEIKDVLERAVNLQGGHVHPGLLHMYLHFWELSSTPEHAIWAADSLRDLVPDGGHLQHMPTHLDVQCGDYYTTVVSNWSAVAADNRFRDVRGSMNFYTLYRAHDLHFVIYGAMFLGQFGTAMNAVEALEQEIPRELLAVESPPMADWLEGFVSMRAHVLVRFGRWDEIIAWPLPDDENLYCVTTAMAHYAKGVAYSATGRVAEAENEQALFKAALARVPESRTIFNNSCTDILQVAEAMLEGELEYRKGNYEAAFGALRKSIELDDNLPYDEPWAWMQPARHAYGALSLEQGAVREAEAVYKADLGLDDTLPRSQQHPNNIWSLRGYLECLERLGKDDLAAVVRQQFILASSRADVSFEFSCFCRTGDDGSDCSCGD